MSIATAQQPHACSAAHAAATHPACRDSHRRPHGWICGWLPGRAAAAVGLLAAAASITAQAATNETLRFSTTVPVFSSTGFQLEAISLPQFDPMLGTLTGVAFEVVIDAYSLDLSLDSYDMSSGGAFHSAHLNGGQYSVSKALPGGGGNLYATLAGLVGEISGEAEALSFVSVGPEVHVQDATGSLQTAGTFDDFIGTGNVPGLSWGYLFFSNSGSFVRLDVGGPFIEVDANVAASQTVGPTTVHVDYTFISTPVPEPATALLLLAGLGVTLRQARRRQAHPAS